VPNAGPTRRRRPVRRRLLAAGGSGALHVDRADDRTWPFSFVNLCGSLGVAVEAVRSRVLAPIPAANGPVDALLEPILEKRRLARGLAGELPLADHEGDIVDFEVRGL
jgi:hypothetical protein